MNLIIKYKNKKILLKSPNYKHIKPWFKFLLPFASLSIDNNMLNNDTLNDLILSLKDYT